MLNDMVRKCRGDVDKVADFLLDDFHNQSHRHLEIVFSTLVFELF